MNLLWPTSKHQLKYKEFNINIGIMSNWNLKMLVFVEGGKLEEHEGKMLAARQEQTTN